MIKNKEIEAILTRNARKATVIDLLTVLLRCLSYCLLAQLLFIILDHYLHFSTTSRVLAFAITFLPPALTFLHFSSKRAHQKLNLIFIAQEIEKDNPQLNNRLVSHLLSKHTSSPATQVLLEDMKKIKVGSKAFPRQLVFYSKALSIILFCGLLYGIASVQSVPLSLARLYVPFISTPVPSKTQLGQISPTNKASLFVEQDWSVLVSAKGQAPESGFVRIYKTNDLWEDFELLKRDHESYHAKLPATGKKLEYTIHLGDVISQKRHVSFTRKPITKKFNILATAPDYLYNSPKSIKQKNFSLLENSHVNFNMIYDQKIDQAEVIWNNKAIPLYCNYDRVKSINLLKVTGPTEYFFRIKGATREQIFESPHYKISIIKDEAPKARITLENGRLFNINQDIPITYTCEDDIALDNIFLTYELRYAKIKKTIALHKSLESPSFNGTYHFSPAKLNIKAEDILTLTIKAEDQRNSEDGSSLSNSIQVNIMPSAKDVSLTDKNDIAEKEYGQERDINEIKRPTPKKKKIETHEGEGQRESQLKEPKLSDLNQKDDKIQKDNNILTEYQRKIIDEFKKELKRLNKSR